jgi:hypothetical protein
LQLLLESRDRLRILNALNEEQYKRISVREKEEREAARRHLAWDNKAKLAKLKARNDEALAKQKAADDIVRKAAEKAGRLEASKVGDVVVGGLGGASPHYQKMGLYALQKEMRDARAVYRNQHGCIMHFDGRRKRWVIREDAGKQGGGGGGYHAPPVEEGEDGAEAAGAGPPPLEMNGEALTPVSAKKKRLFWSATRLADMGNDEPPVEIEESFPPVMVEAARPFAAMQHRTAKKTGELLLSGLTGADENIGLMGVYTGGRKYSKRKTRGGGGCVACMRTSSFKSSACDCVMSEHRE